MLPSVVMPLFRVLCLEAEEKGLGVDAALICVRIAFLLKVKVALTCGGGTCAARAFARVTAKPVCLSSAPDVQEGREAHKQALVSAIKGNSFIIRRSLAALVCSIYHLLAGLSPVTSLYKEGHVDKCKPESRQYIQDSLLRIKYTSGVDR